MVFQRSSDALSQPSTLCQMMAFQLPQQSKRGRTSGSIGKEPQGSLITGKSINSIHLGIKMRIVGMEKSPGDVFSG